MPSKHGPDDLPNQPFPALDVRMLQPLRKVLRKVFGGGVELFHAEPTEGDVVLQVLEVFAEPAGLRGGSERVSCGLRPFGGLGKRRTRS